MTNSTPLSSAAQAVFDAYIAGLASKRRNAIAAALHVAADHFFTDWDATRCSVFLDAIADEIEGVNG